MPQILDYSLDEYDAYADEYARYHPVYENGLVVGHEYPNGTIKFDDEFWEEEEKDGFLEEGDD